MIKITNTTVDIPKSPDCPTSRLSDLALYAVNQAPQGGFDLATIRARLRLMDALNQAEGEIALEDADAATLRLAVATCRWPWSHPAVVELANHVGAL